MNISNILVECQVFILFLFYSFKHNIYNIILRKIGQIGFGILDNVIESIYAWVVPKLQATVLEGLPFLMLCAVHHGVLGFFSWLARAVLNNGATCRLVEVEWSL